MKQSATFPAELHELHPFLSWIRDRAGAAGFDFRTVKKIELACEEAFVNIVRHSNGEEKGTIEVVIHAANGRLEIVLKDQGAPFNPLEEPPPDLDASLEERAVGGLGVHLIRQCMDEAHYRREGNCNCLILVKIRRSSQTR